MGCPEVCSKGAALVMEQRLQQQKLQGCKKGKFGLKIRNAIWFPDLQKRIITLPLHGYHAV